MDRISSYLEGLRIEDNKHELAQNLRLLPSTWDRPKLKPVLATSPNPEQTVLSPASPMLQSSIAQNDVFITDLRKSVASRAPSSIASRASSVSHSSVFSNAARSTSTASSLSSSWTQHSSTERPYASNNRYGSRMGYHVVDLMYYEKPLYENNDRMVWYTL